MTLSINSAKNPRILAFQMDSSLAMLAQNDSFLVTAIRLSCATGC
jgi:hypothetical protein